jgi:sugar phosphate permease
VDAVNSSVNGGDADPVRARRARFARGAAFGQRAGYASFAVAVAAFVVGAVSKFTDAVVFVVVAALVVGSLVLAPAIVVGYAVRAADREDRERGW